ncbi:MAG: flavocytochrome c [Burkholderiaceae bacterium]
MAREDDVALGARRRFIRNAALAGGGLLGASRVVAAPVSTPAATPAWDETFDVIVVGSGVAGSCAAIAAAEAGSRTVVLEKMARLGGTSRYSGLNFACVGSPMQKAKGIEDKPEWLARDMAKVAGNMGSYPLALTMAQTTARTERFLSERGVKWDGRLLKLGGHSVARVLIPEGDGAGLLVALQTHMATLKGLELRKQIKVDELILDDQGRAIGVKVRERYFFDPDAGNDDLENAGGEVRHYRARQGIVFASGGFARDKAFRSAEVPFLAGVATTTNPGATAGALKSLVRAGAHSIHGGLFRFAYPLPTEDMVWGALIDPATAKRFTSEGQGRNPLGTAVLARKLVNGNRNPFMVYDSAGLASFHNIARVQRSLNGLNGIDGTMHKFATLDELAAFFKTDAAVLKTTIADYNAAIAQGKDSEFDKPLERSGRKVNPIATEGPFYGTPVSPRLNYTPGGIRINERAQALRLQDGQPIPGLYVAGEAAGGLHGQERMTACSMPDCSSFGLIAGENVAREPKA